MPPTYVSYIDSDTIRIDNVTDAFIQMINISKYQSRVFKDIFGLSIRFEASQPRFERNDLFDVLQFLNNAKLPFSVQRDWGPSDVMKEFQDRGILEESFIEIFWKGPGDWHLRTIHPTARKPQ